MKGWLNTDENQTWYRAQNWEVISENRKLENGWKNIGEAKVNRNGVKITEMQHMNKMSSNGKFRQDHKYGQDIIGVNFLDRKKWVEIKR